MSSTFNPQFQRIGEILIHLGKISDSQLQEALIEQKNTKEKLGIILINDGLVSEDDLVTVYSMQLGYKKIEESMLLDVDQSAAALVPEEFARQNSVLAISKSETSIVVAMEDPEDITCIDSLKRLTNLNPNVLVAGPTALKKALDQVYGEIKKTDEVQEVIQGIKVISGDENQQEEVDLSPESASSEDAPIVKLVNMILQESIMIHF